MQARFADEDDAATDPASLIEAYVELAFVCRDVGEIEEAVKYENRIRLLADRAKSKEQNQLK